MSVLKRKPHIWGLGLLALAGLVLLPQCLLFPESGFVGEIVENEAPTAQITGGVLVDSTDTLAQIHFYWFGADGDGVVRWFEWAIDDTISENAWRRTTDFDAVIPFQAALPVEGSDFSEWHTFFVRAVDNDLKRSRSDKRYFNAHTVAPTTTITNPVPDINARWASTLRMTWQGEDIDGSRADRLPAYFEYKLVLFLGAVNPADTDAIRRAFQDSTNQFLDSLSAADFPPGGTRFREAKQQWVRVPGTTNTVWLRDMAIGKKYGFAVRAIDEAGAMEPELGWGNWAIFTVQNKNIDLYVSESSLGFHRFDASAYSTWEVSVAPEQRIRFRWIGDATASGSSAGPSNYGFDIPEPTEEIDKAVDGIGGWIGWALREQMIDAISFPKEDEGVTHNFYIKMRDISGLEQTETRGHIAITVARLSFIRKFLYVDDLRLAPRGCTLMVPKPSDAESDAYREWLFSTVSDFLPPAEVPGQFSVFSAGDAQSDPLQPEAFLDTLGLYQTVIWDAGAGQDTGLMLNARNGTLARYSGAGGNLLLLCHKGPVTLITRAFQPNATEPKCPYEGLSTIEVWDPFSFLYQQLHLRDCVDKPRNNISDVEMDRMTMVGAYPGNALYPDLGIDWERWGCDERGMWLYECLWPQSQDPEETPWFEDDDGLEILYRARTYLEGARLDSLPVAWRTFATSEDSAQGITPGRTVVLGFHPYFFEQQTMRGAMTLALRWLVTGSDL